MKKYEQPAVAVFNFAIEEDMLISVSSGGNTGTAWSNQKESSEGWSMSSWDKPANGWTSASDEEMVEH